MDKYYSLKQRLEKMLDVLFYKGVQIILKVNLFECAFCRSTVLRLYETCLISFCEFAGGGRCGGPVSCGA